jgi:hypothetical protein
MITGTVDAAKSAGVNAGPLIIRDHAMSDTTQRPPRPDIKMALEYVTPAVAAAYLKQNRANNRHCSSRWCEEIALMLSTGDFHPTHQAIAFDEDGHLVDGQHRLSAIVSADVGAWLFVARGVPIASVAGMDRNRIRRPEDQARFIRPDLEMTKDCVALARLMNAGPLVQGGYGPAASLKPTDAVMRFFEKHQDAIRFALRYRGQKGAGSHAATPLRAVIARAYYHEDRDLLARFLQVFFLLPPYEVHEEAAAKFRKWVDDPHHKLIISSGGTARAMFYRYSVTAVKLFLAGQTWKRLDAVGPDDDSWPIPDQPPASQAAAARRRKARAAARSEAAAPMLDHFA